MTQAVFSRSRNGDRVYIDWVRMLWDVDWRETPAEGRERMWIGHKEVWQSLSRPHRLLWAACGLLEWLEPTQNFLAFLLLHGSITRYELLWEGWALGRGKSWRTWQLETVLLEEGSVQRESVSSTYYDKFQMKRWGQEGTPQQLLVKSAQFGQTPFTGVSGGREGGCWKKEGGQGNPRMEQRFMLLGLNRK